jgi:hypothetical protein
VEELKARQMARHLAHLMVRHLAPRQKEVLKKAGQMARHLAHPMEAPMTRQMARHLARPIVRTEG